MAVSGSINLTIPAKKLIAASLRVCGVLEHGKEPAREHMESAVFALNLIVKEQSLLGNPVWSVKESSAVTTVVGQAAYTTASSVPSDIEKIESIRYVESSTDEKSLDIIEGDRYDKKIDKPFQGIPEEAYVKLGRTPADISITLWPTPSSTKTLKLRYFAMLDDVDEDVNELNFPIGWGNFLKFELAQCLAEEFPNQISESKIQRLYERSQLIYTNVRARTPQKTDNVIPNSKRYY